MAGPQREWFEKDYYKVLGVAENASEDQLRRAYRKLAKQHHPDAHPGSEERFKEISAAYDVLSDPARRKEYDELRRLGPMAAGGPFRGGGGAPGGGRTFTFSGDDLGGLFGDLLGRFRGGGGAPRATSARRGEDIEAELHLSFLDAVHGVTTTVNVVSEAPCSTCSGSGAAPGTSPTVCPQCGGRGVLDDNQGFFSFSRPCPNCGGRGMVVETPCPTCRGTGMERRPRQVKVRIPPGVDNDQRIRLKGRGGAAPNGGQPGDLYVTVKVAPHPLFTRRGRDLLVTVPVTFAEAALGAEIKVPTLDDPVTLKIPPGTRSGRTFRVRNRGVPSSSGAGTGDLLVTVEVSVPTHLSTAEREAIEALASASTQSPRTHLGV
ncbi:MAG TPA: molecular chaperone DnaJ [Acidimicrobiales bacterium]|nr:molecular chaperone DnaJ [Acidimicrobiales bacterium]